MSTKLSPRNEERIDQLETELSEFTSTLLGTSHPDMMWITSVLSAREDQTSRRISAFLQAMKTGAFPELPVGR